MLRLRLRDTLCDFFFMVQHSSSLSATAAIRSRRLWVGTAVIR